MTTNSANKRFGFTIIELMIVISIIGILSVIVSVGYTGFRQKAKIAAAQSDMKEIKNAINIMMADTGDRPVLDGTLPIPNSETSCSGDLSAIRRSGVDIFIDDDFVGLANPAGNPWLSVSGWKGPYLESAGRLDPWGHKYGYDLTYKCPKTNPDDGSEVKITGCTANLQSNTDYFGEAIVSFGSADCDSTDSCSKSGAVIMPVCVREGFTPD